ENTETVDTEDPETYDTLKITERVGPSTGTITTINLFDYNVSTNTWALSSGWDTGESEYLRWESAANVISGGGTIRTETREVREESSTGTLLAKTITTYESFPWGEEVT